MVRCKGILVTIKVDGMDLEEFDAPLDAEVETEIEEGKVIRYIEAEGGKEFTIEQSVDLELADLTGCEAVSCLIFVDGSHVNSKVGRRADQCRTSSKGRIHMKKQVGYVQPFIFKEIDINLTTGPSTKHLQSSFISSDLGVIEVKVLRASKCTKNEKPSDFAAPITQNTLTIQESKLKGLTTSHGTCYGKAREQIVTCYSIEHIDSIDNPYARFRFYYRSRASLQILGIIPRTPSPPLVLPLEMRDPCSLSQAEAIELVRILREENKTQKNALKREYHSDEDDTNVPLVQAERRVKRRIQNGETVVLDD